MSIHEERDIVLTKIHILSQRDQVVSCDLTVRELENEYQLSRERSESAIWYFSDLRYVTRDRKNRDNLRLTSRGLNVIDEGGFVQQRLNNRLDLGERIDELFQSLSQLEERITALEGPSETQEEPIPRQEQKRPLKQQIALIVGLGIVSALVAWAIYSLLVPSS
ncbi:MAG: hypothetical protein AAFZ63_02125 [Bacteroidota bacterium]